MNFADITNDIAFRKIFGNENKKKSLISFLNAVINLPQNEQIVDVERNYFIFAVVSCGLNEVAFGDEPVFAEVDHNLFCVEGVALGAIMKQI